jgi:hypothetical protein
MRRSIVAATVAASVTMGGLIGSTVGTPALAGAVETAQSAAGWVDEALGGLVADGTITQVQADAVGAALEAARPEHGEGHRGGGRMDLSAVATALGMSDEELRSALEGDQTIADIAAAQGIDVATVVDAVVTAQRERLAERVAAGDLTQAEADAKLADAEARATAVVDGERPAFAGSHRHGGPPDRMLPTGGAPDTTGTTAS